MHFMVQHLFMFLAILCQKSNILLPFSCALVSAAALWPPQPTLTPKCIITSLCKTYYLHKKGCKNCEMLMIFKAHSYGMTSHHNNLENNWNFGIIVHTGVFKHKWWSFPKPNQLVLVPRLNQTVIILKS